jgi:hypothetical protein
LIVPFLLLLIYSLLRLQLIVIFVEEVVVFLYWTYSTGVVHSSFVFSLIGKGNTVLLFGRRERGGESARIHTRAHVVRSLVRSEQQWRRFWQDGRSFRL